MTKYGTSVYSSFKYGTGTEPGPQPVYEGDLIWILQVYWNNQWVNESSRILGMERFRRGREYVINPAGRGFERVDPGEAVFTLDNKNRRYDPYNSSSPLYGYIRPGRRARVMVKYRTNNVTYTLLTGQIADIQPTSGHERVRLVINDYIRYLEDQDTVTVPASYNTTHSAAIQAVLNAANYPGAQNIRPATSPMQIFSGGELQAMDAIRELADASLGTFFVGRDGRANYYPLNYNSQPTHSLNQTQILKLVKVSQPWETVRNRAVVYANRRGLTRGYPIWTSSYPIAVPSMNNKIVDISFPEGQGLSTGPGWGFEVNDQPDGSGYNATFVSWVSITNVTATSARLILRNNLLRTVYFLWIKIYGQALITEKSYSDAEDATSIAAYSKKAVILDSAYLQDEGHAEAYATILVDQLKNGQRNPVVQIENRPAQQFGYELFDKLALSVSELGINDTFNIGQIEHDWIDRGDVEQGSTGQAVRTTLYLQKLLYSNATITPRPFYPGVPDIPQEPITPLPPGTPPTDPPALDPTAACLLNDAGTTGPFALNFQPKELYSSDPNKLEAIALFPCTLRGGSATNRSYFDVECSAQRWTGSAWVQDSSNAWITVTAFDGEGNDIITGSVTNISGGGGWQFTKRVRFSPAGPLSVRGFRIKLDETQTSDEWIEGALLATGLAGVKDSTGTAYAATVGNGYMVYGTAGYWKPSPGHGLNYNVSLSGPLSNTQRILAYNGLYSAYVGVATGTPIYIKILDSSYGDNSGPGIDWELHAATPPGSEIRYYLGITWARIYNVCG
jgi:hypothetical protein